MNRQKITQLESQLASLYARINYERQLKVTPRHFKLRNMREFLRRLDNPHLKYPVIHVAGTKGKGSVTTMIGQILIAAGYKTGIYVSPHLESINQRMAMAGQLITDKQLSQTLANIEPIANEMDQEADAKNHRPLTFFEVTTAAAFCFFADQNADAVVLEVGLGGRMDSTNVCQPEVSVITNISFDHTRQLGTTLDKIAYEKAGIVKRDIPVVSGVTKPIAAKVIQNVAAENNSKLFVLDQDFKISHLSRAHSNSSSTQFNSSSAQTSPSHDNNLNSVNEQFDVSGSLDDQTFVINDIELALLGQHQQTNAAIAIAAVSALNKKHWHISDNQIRSGLAQSRLPGRTEVVHQRPMIMLDIAHNVASVQALVKTLPNVSAWNSSTKKTLIIATSREKDAEQMLKPLVEIFDEVILTKFQNNPRGKHASELHEIANSILADTNADDSALASRKMATLKIEATPTVAWNSVTVDLRDNHFVCIAGSAFLVAELRPVVQKWAKNMR